MSKASNLTDWIEFLKLYWSLTDDDQKRSYLLNMIDGKAPPPMEAIEDMEEYDRARIQKHMGVVIKKYREQKDIEQQDLAEALGKSPSTVSLVESGERAFTAADLAVTMRFLDIPPDELFMIGTSNS